MGWLAERVGLATCTVSTTLQQKGRKPHRMRTDNSRREPAFAEEVPDVLGLCLNPPGKAIIPSVHVKTQIQALDAAKRLVRSRSFGIFGNPPVSLMYFASKKAAREHVEALITS